MKSVIKKDRVRVGEHAARTMHADVALDAPEERSTPAPGVRLVRIAGRIEAIEVTCRCGEVSVIEVEYDGVEQPPEEKS